MTQNRPEILESPVLNYNYYFNPNICHVCKEDCVYQECPACRKIYYCSEEHMMLHLPQHREICEAIVKVSKSRDMLNFRGTTKQWNNFKKENMEAVKQELRRDLAPYEQQMFLFAKSCRICHLQDNLQVICRHCLYGNMCSDHILLFQKDHNCANRRQCFMLDISQAKQDPNKRVLGKIDSYIDPDTIYDTESFLQLWMREAEVLQFFHLEFTDYFSRPLTLFYGLRDANLLRNMPLRTTLVIHIIDGSFNDINSLLAWEFLLHQCGPAAKILIIMIGPDLQEKCHDIELCDICLSQERTLQYKYYRNFYHDYVVSRDLQPPHVIIGFNAEFSDAEIMTSTIQAVRRQNCIFLLTTKSEYKAKEYINKIQKILDRSALIPVISTKNNFVSWRQYRNHENNYVFCPNHYLIIYVDLMFIREPIQVSSK
ncbi:uncharacterized protein LOC116846887 [Odontomachus brunneus]|uniref:uncharacterized protein LOC116846887 n=1 Tax=Odontomachus brunneus TaxID=486640 RepID=UPI0013F29557|nr:uncharacterized protein LOC116846887 [Odontomachus brunneus]